MSQPVWTKWSTDIISADSVKLRDYNYLLWSDRVRVLEKNDEAGRVRLFARGTTGCLPESALGGDPVLELHIIDVGQGDGILAVTPEGHHLTTAANRGISLLTEI